MIDRILVYTKRAISDPRWLYAKTRLLINASLPMKARAEMSSRKKKYKNTYTNKNPDLLVCVYDLEQLPITFNVLEYLCAYNSIATMKGKKFS